MARKKTITRDQILNAAYEVVAENGFSKFTARNIATQMNCSTQPIYLEFKNMEDLKQELIKSVLEKLSDEVLSKEQTGDSLVDLGLNYIEFAHKENNLYKSLFMENDFDGKKVHELSYEYFKNDRLNEGKYADFTEEKKRSVYTGFWIIVSGFAALTSSNIIDFSKEDTIDFLEKAIAIIIHQEENVTLSFDELK